MLDTNDGKKPVISIIMPTYNCGKYIAESIESVEKQTYSKWELIIIDDGSIDNTEQVVKFFLADKRIIYKKLPFNIGAAMARNRAMELATGEYMAFLDSDDVWYKEKLERQLDFMQKNNCNISCTSYEKVMEDGTSRMPPKLVKTIPKVSYERFLFHAPVGNSTVMYNVNVLGKFQGPNIRKSNDLALWLQMLKKEKYIFGMPDILMRYRIRKGSISSNKLSTVKYHWQLFYKIERVGVFKTVLNILCCGIKSLVK